MQLKHGGGGFLHEKIQGTEQGNQRTGGGSKSVLCYYERCKMQSAHAFVEVVQHLKCLLARHHLHQWIGLQGGNASPLSKEGVCLSHSTQTCSSPSEGNRAPDCVSGLSGAGTWQNLLWSSAVQLLVASCTALPFLKSTLYKPEKGPRFVEK